MIRRDTARRLCTAREYELVEASFPQNLKRLTPSAVRKKVERARRLRDKNRDLLKRQRLEVRGKRAPRRTRAAQGTANTEKKVEIFEEVLERFQYALKQPAAKKLTAKKSAAKKPTTRKSAAKKPTAKKSTAKKPTAKKSQTSLRQRKDAKNQALGRTLRARGRAANQRGQKRRDGKGR